MPTPKQMEKLAAEAARRPGPSAASPDAPLPAEYYRRHAARVRQLANEATTAAVKEHLREVALEYERLAERVDNGSPPAEF